MRLLDQIGIRLQSQGLETVISAPATFGAGPMTCRQSGGFVQEEEAGIMTGSYHLERFPAWSQSHGTENPGFGRPVPSELTARIVQNASIAHHRTAFLHGDDLVKGGNPVLVEQLLLTTLH